MIDSRVIIMMIEILDSVGKLYGTFEGLLMKEKCIW